MVGIFAIDPGTHSGVDYGLWDTNCGPKDAMGLWDGINYELSGDLLTQAGKICDDWLGFVENNPSVECYLVIESYAQRPTPHMVAAEALDPVRLASMIVGRLSVLYEGRGELLPHIYWQTPATAMRAATNERLRMWGAWVVGSEHRRDARRHSLAFRAALAIRAGT